MAKWNTMGGPIRVNKRFAGRAIKGEPQTRVMSQLRRRAVSTRTAQGAAKKVTVEPISSCLAGERNGPTGQPDFLLADVEQLLPRSRRKNLLRTPVLDDTLLPLGRRHDGGSFLDLGFVRLNLSRVSRRGPLGLGRRLDQVLGYAPFAASGEYQLS